MTTLSMQLQPSIRSIATNRSSCIVLAQIMLSNREQGVSCNCTELARVYLCMGSWGSPSLVVGTRTQTPAAVSYDFELLIVDAKTFVPIAL